MWGFIMYIVYLYLVLGVGRTSNLGLIRRLGNRGFGICLVYVVVKW